jgi:hypothetical protein
MAATRHRRAASGAEACLRRFLTALHPEGGGKPRLPRARRRRQCVIFEPGVAEHLKNVVDSKAIVYINMTMKVQIDEDNCVYHITVSP